MLQSESEPEQDKVCGCDVWAIFGLAICDSSRLSCALYNGMKIVCCMALFFFFPLSVLSDATSQST